MPQRSSDFTEHDVAPRVTASDAIVEVLAASGCRRAFGILGGAALPFFDALVRGGLQPIHFRHEAGAVFAAIEHELAHGGPAVIFTTTGPGLINTLTGVVAARWDGARVVVVSAGTGSDRRGRWAFQETNDRTLPQHGLFSDGGWFDYACALQSPDEVPVVAARLREGLARPQGFVAHISLPLSVQEARIPRPNFPVQPRPHVPVAAPEFLVDACAEQIHGRRVCVWLGYGARQAWAEVRRFVDAVGARVMCSPRAKGIFPESDPRFLGVTGFGGHEQLFDALAAFAPHTTLVLGSRLGEFTSFWDRRLVDTECLIHVDLDPRVFSAAYPLAPTLPVQAEIRGFMRELLARLPCPPVRTIGKRRLRALTPPLQRVTPTVRASALMGSLQRVVVDRTDIPVLSEAGNAFVWTTHELSFDQPGRYRTSMGFGSMGHAAAGVVGLALARSGPALAVVGDGALLMNNEISTAVSLGVPAIWVVLNDARYGLVADGMQGLGYAPVGLEFSQVDFAAFARSMGAEAETVHHEMDLDDVLQEAISAQCPFVVDVRIDTTEQAPFGARNRSLADQKGAS